MTLVSLIDSNLKLKIDDQKFSNESLDDQFLIDHDWKTISLLKCNFENCEIHSSLLVYCTFNNCTFMEQLWRKVFFKNCRFENCNFNNLNLSRVDFENSQFRNCNFNSLNVGDCTFRDCEFRQITWKNSQLQSTGFFYIQIEESNFDNLKFNKKYPVIYKKLKSTHSIKIKSLQTFKDVLK